MALKKLSTHRVGVHAMYYNIAREHAERYHQRDAECAALEAGPAGEEELSEFKRRMEECDEDHLDKLDLKSKFLTYPRLVGGKSPEKSGAAYR